MESFYYAEKCSTSIKVLGLASRCYKVCPYSYKRSIYIKCVSEILQPQTHNNKRVLGRQGLDVDLQLLKVWTSMHLDN